MSARKNYLYFAVLWLGTVLGACLTFLLQVVLARKLGTELYGVFSAALVLVTTVAPLAGFGVAQFWLKIFGITGWSARAWLPASFNFVILSSMIVMLFLFLWAFFGHHNQMTASLIYILSFYVLGQMSVELVSSKLQLEERYTYLAAWQFLPHLFRFVLVGVLLYAFESLISLENIAYIYILVSVLFLLAGIVHLRGMSQGRFMLVGHKMVVHEEVSKINIASVLKNAWPFGLAAFFHLIYFQSDIVLIKYMVGDHQAGIYNVAFTVMVAVYMFPNVLYQKFLLPKLHRWANHNREKFYNVYSKGNIIMLIFGTIAMLLIWLFSSTGITLVFGSRYMESISILDILAVSSPIIFVAHSAGATLVTQDHMKLKVKYMGTVAMLNLVLNFIFIPLYGGVGAAMTTVVSNFVLLALYYHGAQINVFNITRRA